jgi:carbon storage regulator
MLVLSRRVGQQIRIGKSVLVTLLKVERNKARIGVDAPPGIPVFRQELLDFDRRRPAASATQPPAENHLPLRGDLRFRPLTGRGFATAQNLWDSAAV